MNCIKPIKLNSGNYRCQILVNGQRVSFTEPTEQECIRKAQEYKARHVLDGNTTDITLEQAYLGYIENCVVLSPSTIAGYKRLSRNTMQGIMKRQLKHLTNEMVQAEINKMVKEGKSAKYIANAHGLLSAVLKFYYPQFTLNTRLPKKTKYQQRMLSEEEIKKIMEVCKDTPIEVPVLMGLWLGMRLSEILGVEYSDIQDGVMHINKAVVLDENYNWVEKTTKTYESDRYVSVPKYLQQIIGQGEGRIVTLTGHAIYNRFSRLCAKNGIEHCRFHDLRSANAAVMIRLGVDSKYAQERNGWSTDRMYKQVYGYVMREKMEEEAKKIDNFFNPLLTNYSR